MAETSLIPVERIVMSIVAFRGQKVIIDESLASLYEVNVKVLNQAVKRNIERFPSDFLFQLDEAEAESLRSQFVTLKNGRGRHRKYLPYAFTEQGVAMLSSVLRSPRAVSVNIEIMRAFVKMRQLMQSNMALARKLDALERKYDERFRVVFDAIRRLMLPPAKQKIRPIGFAAKEK